MFTKPLTRAPRYIVMKSFSLAIGRSYLRLSHSANCQIHVLSKVTSVV